MRNYSCMAVWSSLRTRARHGRKPAAARDADLGRAAEQEGVSARYATGPERLAHLIRTLQVPAGQRVAVVVDEYGR